MKHIITIALVMAGFAAFFMIIGASISLAYSLCGAVLVELVYSVLSQENEQS